MGLIFKLCNYSKHNQLCANHTKGGRNTRGDRFKLTKPLALIGIDIYISNGVLESISHVPKCDAMVCSAFIMFPTNNTRDEMNGLEVVEYAPDRLDLVSMDFISMEDTSVRAYLDAHPENFVLFSGSLVHFSSLDSLVAAFQHGTVFSCVTGDALIGNSNLDDQLFNTAAIGVSSGVFIPLDQAIAIQALVHQNQRTFALTAHTTRTVEFAASVHAYESGEGTVGGKHCNPGSGAHVKDVLAVRITGNQHVHPSVDMVNRFNEQVFLRNADAIVRHQTTSMNHPLVAEILTASQNLGLQGLRSLVKMNVRWNGDHSDIDKNILKLIAMFQPTIQELILCHGHPVHRHETAQFIDNMVGLSKVSLFRRDVHDRNERNGFEIRAIVSSLVKHASTLTYMYLDEIDTRIPSLSAFTNLQTLRGCFTDSRFLGDVFTHTSLQDVKLKATQRQAFGSAGEEFVEFTTRSRIQSLRLDVPTFVGGLNRIVNMPRLIELKLVAPRAHIQFSPFFSHPTLEKLTIHSDQDFDNIVDDPRASKIKHLSLKIPNYTGNFEFLLHMPRIISANLPILPPDLEQRAVVRMNQIAEHHP